MNDKKKRRNTTSWKTEAESLTALLAVACELLATVIADTPELAEWWEHHKDTSETRKAEIKARALAKLTPEERAALGVPL